jgi:hypothetical protein
MGKKQSQDEVKPAFLGWDYLGGGFLPGVPARDITAGEAERRGITDQLNKCALYERVYEEVNDGGR